MNKMQNIKDIVWYRWLQNGQQYTAKIDENKGEFNVYNEHNKLILRRINLNRLELVVIRHQLKKWALKKDKCDNEPFNYL